MNGKIVCLLLLVVFAFATITNVLTALNIQSTDQDTPARGTGYNDNPEVEPAGDGHGGIPSPRNSTGE